MRSLKNIVRSLVRYFRFRIRYLSNYSEFKNQIENYEGEKYITKISSDKLTVFQEGFLRLDFIYAYQDIQAFDLFNQIVRRDCIAEFLDVGSRLSSMLFFATTAKCFYLEQRSPNLNKLAKPFLNIEFVQGEGQKLDFPAETFKLITCLHALEHFGLGRYGDRVDYQGDFKALVEFSRVLELRGTLLLSVPYSFSNPRIEFHKERKYSKDIISAMLNDAGFILKEHYFISPTLVASPYTQETDTYDHDAAILLVAEKKREME